MKHFIILISILCATAFPKAVLADEETLSFALTSSDLRSQNKVTLQKNTESWFGEKRSPFSLKPLFALHQNPRKLTIPTALSRLDRKNITPEIIGQILSTKKLAQDARLVMSGKKVEEFTPDQNNFLPDVPRTIAVLAKSTPNPGALEIIGVFSPASTPLSKTNNLGINTLIGRGRSSFKGSSKNRRTNIKVGMEKTRGIILAPGETFSFNNLVGGVEAKDGFVPEIVIKKDGLTPELGGGLCQVSSTIFRGAVASGLAIDQRKNHSFAVSHYAPQGTDATTYTGVIDLKFTNNTPAHVLIWPYFENEDTLVYDYYGTDDGRVVTVNTPSVYDRKSDGSMKTVWERKVVLQGKETQDSFKSTYLPPALFKKVETFVPPAQTTETTNQSQTAQQTSNQTSAPAGQ